MRLVTGDRTQELAAKEAFEENFVPIKLAHEHLFLSPQYARRVVLDSGIEGIDWVRVFGRIYVTKSYLNDLLKVRQDLPEEEGATA